MQNKVLIQYCPRCRWLPRAAWLAQEILGTFHEYALEVTLQPAPSGVFNVYCNNDLIYSNKRDRRFPEPKGIKQSVRDIVAPELNLGHTDNQ